MVSVRVVEMEKHAPVRLERTDAPQELDEIGDMVEHRAGHDEVVRAPG
jgi:hypothetical protein